MGQLPSAKDSIVSDTTTSAVYEDVDGLTVQVTVDDTSDILLLACIQAEGSTSAKAGWRLVFDGTNFLDLERQVGSEPGNVSLADLVPNKGPGTYTFKLQHKVDGGTLTTGHADIIAVSLHNGAGAVPAESDYVASDTVGNSWADITGLSVDITLSKTSHIWALLVLNGYHSGSNKDTDFAINIDSTRMEVHDRDWQASGEYGCVSINTRTDTEKSAGVYTVKAEWKGSGGSTFTGEDIKLIVIAAEANSGAVGIQITKDIVVSDTTTATSLEDIDGLSVTASPEETAHILAYMTLSTDVSQSNTSAYTVIDINGVDSEIMERGHSSAARWGSIGCAERTASPLAAGDYTVKGEWYTDPTNTLSGANIVLTTIVLSGFAATVSGEDVKSASTRIVLPATDGEDVKSASTRIKLLSEDVKSASTRIKRLTEDTKSASTNIKRLTEDVKSASTRIAYSSQVTKSASTRIAYTSQDVKSASTRISIPAEGEDVKLASTRIKRLSQDVKSASTNIKRIAEDIKNASTRIAYSSEDTKSASTNIKRVTEDIKSASTRITVQVYSEDVKSASTNIKIVSQSVKSASTRIYYAGYDTKLASTRIKRLTEDIKTANTNIKRLTEDIKSASTQIKLLNEDVKNASTRIKRLTEDIKTASTRIKRVAESIKSASTRIGLLTTSSEDVKNASTRIAYTSQDVKSASTRILGWGQDIKAASTRIKIPMTFTQKGKIFTQNNPIFRKMT